MNEIISYIPIVVAGLALGVFYWGGLWWTCHRVMDGRTHVGLMGLSYFVRLAVVVAAMYVLGRDSTPNLVIIVLAMLAVRVLMGRRLSMAPAEASGPGGEKEGADSGDHS